MTWPADRRGDDRSDDHLPDRYLVDGVAPPVIGGEPVPAGEPRPAAPPAYRDPPTAPIPAQGGARRNGQRRKAGWLGRMFGRNPS